MSNKYWSFFLCVFVFTSLWIVDDYLGHPWDYLYKAFIIFTFIFYPLLKLVLKKSDEKKL